MNWHHSSTGKENVGKEDIFLSYIFFSYIFFSQERKMWERKIRVESGVYLFSCPFCPFCFLLRQFSVKLLAQVEKISAVSRRGGSTHANGGSGGSGRLRTPSARLRSLSSCLICPKTTAAFLPNDLLANRKSVKAPSDTS
jgi:hypothetical protein